MAFEPGKFKLLNLIRIFEECTDENHGLTMPQIIEKLGECGVHAERKALYRDIQALNEFGLTIKKFHCAPVEYRLVGRRFTFNELQLLVDAVQSCRFLTQGNADKLVRSIKTLCSEEQGKQLSRRIHVGNRVKMQNESAFKNIDIINAAIRSKHKVEFMYYKYDCGKRPVAQHDGKLYCETPVQMVFNDGFYYLITFNDKHESFITYRIDRMTSVAVSSEPSVRNQAISHFDVEEYERRSFGMFAGEPVSATLIVHEEAMGGVIDRFGKEVESLDKGDGTAEVHVRVMESPTFFGWLAQYGRLIHIAAPRALAGAYREYLVAIAQEY